MFYVKTILVLIFFTSMVSGLFYFFYNFPLELILTHLLICLALFSLCVGTSILTRHLDRSNNHPGLQSLPLAVVTTALIFLYIANYLSNYLWGANVNINLLSRMFEHYYKLYLLQTLALALLIPAISTLLILALFYQKFRKNTRPLKNPVLNAFYCFSLSIFIFTNIYTYKNKRSDEAFRSYFSGEMLLDLFEEYTDAHLDYLEDADSPQEKTHELIQYIPQRKETIDRNKKNIILVVVDCLRADHMKSYGYHRETTPFIDSIARKHNSWQVENTFSICDESKCGIRSILTSQGFQSQNSNEARQNTLHGNLRKHGYQINFLLTSDHRFGGLKRTYSPHDYYIDGMGFNDYHLSDDRGIISALKNWPPYNGSPNYFHLHLFSAHEMGTKYGKYLNQGVHGIKPGFLKETPIDPKFSSTSPSSQQKRDDGMDNGIFQVDLVYSQIHQILSQKGYMDNALIIITGDHGQGLGEHGYIGHIKGLYNESLRIPLIFIDTSGDDLPLKEETFATQLDIAPTIVELVDIPRLEAWKGVSLQQEKTEKTVSTHFVPGRSNSYAKIFYDPISGSLYKYIFISTLRDMKEEHYFYDLLKDPGEITNLYDSLVTETDGGRTIMGLNIENLTVKHPADSAH